MDNPDDNFDDISFNSSDAGDEFLSGENIPRDSNNETIEPIQKNPSVSNQNKSLLNFNASLQKGEVDQNSKTQNQLNSIALPKSQVSPNQNNLNAGLKSKIQHPNSQFGSPIGGTDKSGLGSGSRLLMKKTIDKAQDTSKITNESISGNTSPTTINKSQPTLISPTQSPTSQDNLSQSDLSFPSLPSFSPPNPNQKNGGFPPMISNSIQDEPIVQHFEIPGIPSVDDSNPNNSQGTPQKQPILSETTNQNLNLPPLNDVNNTLQTNLKPDIAKNSPSHLPPIPNQNQIPITQTNTIKIIQPSNNIKSQNSQNAPTIIQPQIGQIPLLNISDQNQQNNTSHSQIPQQQSDPPISLNRQPPPLNPIQLNVQQSMDQIQPNFTQMQIQLSPIQRNNLSDLPNESNNRIGQIPNQQTQIPLLPIQETQQSLMSQTFYNSPKSPTYVYQQHHPSEKVHITFQAAMDQSFTNLRKSIMSELDSILRINRNSSQNRSMDLSSSNTHGYSFDVDQFCEHLNSEIINILSLVNSSNECSLPMKTDESHPNSLSISSYSKKFLFLQTIERELKSSIDREIKPFLSNAKMVNEKLQEKKDKNIQNMKDLIQEIESLRLSCKSFGEEIVFQLEKEAMNQESNRDLEIAKNNTHIRKLKEMKLQTVDIQSKLSQLNQERHRIFEGLRQLKQQRIQFNSRSNIQDDFDSFNDSNNKKKRKGFFQSRYNLRVLNEINEIGEEIQSSGFGQICLIFEELKLALDKDENEMRNDIMDIKYDQFNMVQPKMNYFFYQTPHQQSLYPRMREKESDANATFNNHQNESLMISPFKQTLPNRHKQQISGSRSSNSVIKQKRK